jgi:hypothetical protein
MQVSIGNIPLPLAEELNSALYIFGITAVNPPCGAAERISYSNRAFKILVDV